MPALTRGRSLLIASLLLATFTGSARATQPSIPTPQRAAGAGQVAILLVDTDRITGHIDERIYGHFLEHINHSVEDGLYAEQIRGQGFEANDFRDYWEKTADPG